MPVNQPPISQDIVLSSWQYEVTETANSIEQEVRLGRASRGPTSARPDIAPLGTDYYDTTQSKWFKYDTTDGWIEIGG